MVGGDHLPWNFEAFRRYLVYRRMQQAAAVLANYEGEILESRNPAMERLLGDLQDRTGEDWLPKRAGVETVNFNVEGDFYRNKGRLLTSFYVLTPKQLFGQGPPVVRLTPFGQALAAGAVSEVQYYEFIITRFSYPHPAYDENWDAWTNANRSLRPLLFVLEILATLYKRDRSLARTNSIELATYAYPASDHGLVERVTEQIVAHRKGGGRTAAYSDEVNRKINDMLGFLSVSGYTFYDGQWVCLNLMGVHPQEQAYYWESRSSKEYDKVSRLDEIERLFTL